MTDAYQATIDPRVAPQGDALAARPPPSDPLDADYRGMIGDVRQSMADERRTAAEREQALAPLRQQQIQQLRQPQPQPPQQQQMPATPQTRNQPGADESWLMAVGVLGAIAAGVTRNHASNALAAMTGAMEGYNEGNRQRFDMELQKWKAEGEKVRETNKAANERYKQILESNKLALEQKSMEIQLTAARFDDKAAMQLAQTKQFETLGRLIEQRMSHQEQMQKHAEDIAEKAREWHQRERMAREANEARVQAAQLRANSRGAGMSPEAVDLRVDMAITGNPNATKGMRAGSPDFEAFSNRLAEVAKERGIPADELARMQQQYQGGVSGARSTGTRVANLENIQRSVASIVPQALDASAALARTRWVPVNQAIQLVQSAKGTPQLEAFATVNINLAELWARSQKPTGQLDVALQQMALGRLSTAKNDQAYRTIVNQIVESIDRERRAAEAQSRNEPMQRPQVPGAFVPPKTGSPDMPVPASPDDQLGRIKSKLPQGWSVEPVP